jgi:hypothetical protein
MKGDKMKEKDIAEMVEEIKIILQDSWSENTKNLKLAGCYKALSAIFALLNEEGDDNKGFVFTRLSESMVLIASHYGLGLEEALKTIQKKPLT